MEENKENQSPQDGPVLRDHIYDGIQEYDQKLPNWWLWTWYITIIWFVIAWVGYYQLGYGQTDHQSLDGKLAEIAEIRAKELESIDDAKLWAMSKEPDVVARGEEVFKTTCVACHAADLSGMAAGVKLPGLPLNDSEWKHGGSPTQVMEIVRKGAPDITKGMMAWEPQLGISRVADVVAYVMSYHEEGAETTLSADSPLLETSEEPAAATN